MHNLHKVITDDLRSNTFSNTILEVKQRELLHISGTLLALGQEGTENDLTIQGVLSK